MEIGVILCTHSDFAAGLKGAVEMIAGEQKNLKAVCFHNGSSMEDLLDTFAAIDEQFKKEGVPYIFMTDMFAATPCNAALTFAVAHPCCIVCGASLPLLLEILLSAQNLDPKNREVPEEFLDLCVKNANNNVKVLDSKKLFAE